MQVESGSGSSQSWTAEVISIGDEMTSGARVDTNAAWLSRRLEELGVTVAFHTTVGDTLEHNVAVFLAAAQRADVVVATGGLGPTQDDLTREALAAAAGVPLELSDESLRHIEALFAGRGREMPERNRVQAMFPAGSREIFNPQGTAPGIDLTVQSAGLPPSRIFALPGVPAEMKRMFDETVAPRILQQTGSGRRIRQRVLKFFGTGESDMERRLGGMIARGREPRVGITVSRATISLRITATGTSDEACEQQIEETAQQILKLVPEYHFGEGEEFEQHHAVDKLLRERKETLAVIELGRAAPLGDWFASLGSTPAYRGGLSLADASDLQSHFDAMNEAETIVRAKKAMRCHWLLIVDGYPELHHNHDQPQPASDVQLKIFGPRGTKVRERIRIGGHPDILQARIAKTALATFRKLL